MKNLTRQPGSFELTSRQQLILRAFLWFSSYGLVVTLLLNSVLWLILGPMEAYLSGIAEGAEGSINLLSALLERVRVIFWGFSGYLLLLIIGCFFGLRCQQWAYWLTFLLLLIAVAGIVISFGVGWAYKDILYDVSPVLLLSLGLLFSLVGILFGWLIFQLAKR